MIFLSLSSLGEGMVVPELFEKNAILNLTLTKTFGKVVVRPCGSFDQAQL